MFCGSFEGLGAGDNHGPFDEQATRSLRLPATAKGLPPTLTLTKIRRLTARIDDPSEKQT